MEDERYSKFSQKFDGKEKIDMKDILKKLTLDSIYSEGDLELKKEETHNIIHKEISELKDKFRDVIILCDIEKKSYKEAARILGISVGTVQSRLSRGRLKLRQRLEKVLK